MNWKKIVYYAGTLVVAVAVAYLVYLYIGLKQENRLLNDSLNRAGEANQNLSLQLSSTTDALAKLELEVGGLSSTVGTLRKLAATDPELLKQYSKVYFLNENYVPKGLVAIEPSYKYDQKKDLYYLGQAYPFLTKMMDDAKSAGLNLKVDSAYRSFGTQSSLKAAYKMTYGAGTANSFSADQGYSEHQLGTAIDFTTASTSGVLTGFQKTPEYKWLIDNAYKYGFALSYPQNNPSYIYEPWHWRFVGVSLATRLREEKENFYDLTQRQIDPYLVSLFDPIK